MNVLNKWIGKYARLSEPVKASVWFTFSNILRKGISLLATPIFTRILTQEQYGMYAQYQTWVGIVTIFATLNLFLGNYTKGLVEFESRRDAFTSAVYSLTTVVSLVFFGLFLLAPDFWSDVLGLHPYLIAMMFVEIIAMSAYEFWAARERFDFRYKTLTLIGIVMSLSSLLFGIIAVLLATTYKFEARVVVDVLVKTVVGVSVAVGLYAKGKTFFNKQFWLYALAFNLPLIPHFLSNLVLNQVDRIMIGNMIGDAEVAKYSVAYTIAMMMQLVTTAVNNAYIPYTYKSIKNNEHSKLRTSATGLAAMVALLCVVAMVFAPEIIKIFADSDYADAIWVVPPVAASVYFIFIYSLFSNIEYYYKKTKQISVATVICALLNVLLNYLFIKLFGYHAAAYTTLICYILLATAHYCFYKRVIKREMQLSNLYNVKAIVLIGAAMLVMMLALLLTYEHWVLRYGMILVFAVAVILLRKKIVGLVKMLMSGRQA